MNPVSLSPAMRNALPDVKTPELPKNAKPNELEKAFQDFVAGTFYKEMFKAMRRGQRKPAYLDGGTAEKIFQGQMDETVAEDLAKTRGADFSGPLFSSFARHIVTKGSSVGTGL